VCKHFYKLKEKVVRIGHGRKQRKNGERMLLDCNFNLFLRNPQMLKRIGYLKKLDEEEGSVLGCIFIVLLVSL
jgi:hypothetical protein